MTETDPRTEALAAYAHKAWSGWMEYLFSKCERHITTAPENGYWLHLKIPRALYHRWQRQMKTPYEDLPESEKDRNRAEAAEMLKIIDSPPDAP